MFTTLLPTVLKIVGFFLDRAGANAATQAAFRALLDAAQAQGLVPLKLKQSYDSQLDRINAELAAAEKKTP